MDILDLLRTTVLQRAWHRGQVAAVHGWIYALHDGLIRDLHVDIDRSAAVSDALRGALARLPRQ